MKNLIVKFLVFKNLHHNLFSVRKNRSKCMKLTWKGIMRILLQDFERETCRYYLCQYNIWKQLFQVISGIAELNTNLKIQILKFTRYFSDIFSKYIFLLYFTPCNSLKENKFHCAPKRLIMVENICPEG